MTSPVAVQPEYLWEAFEVRELWLPLYGLGYEPKSVLQSTLPHRRGLEILPRVSPPIHSRTALLDASETLP